MKKSNDVLIVELIGTLIGEAFVIGACWYAWNEAVVHVTRGLVPAVTLWQATLLLFLLRQCRGTAKT